MTGAARMAVSDFCLSALYERNRSDAQAALLHTGCNPIDRTGTLRQGSSLDVSGSCSGRDSGQCGACMSRSGQDLGKGEAGAPVTGGCCCFCLESFSLFPRTRREEDRPESGLNPASCPLHSAPCDLLELRLLPARCSSKGHSERSGAGHVKR